MDSKDFRLLVALHGDGRQSLQRLGRSVSLSAPAVRNRLRRLEELDVLQGYWVSVDPAIFRRKDLFVFFGGEWSREDAIRTMEASDVAWVARKFDGGLTVKVWPHDAQRALATLSGVLERPPHGHVVAPSTERGELSPIDWRVIDALLDDPRARIRALAEATGLSPKTVRKHLAALTRAGVISILPRLGSLTGAGDLVYHLAVHGTAPMPELRRVLGDAVLIHETREPPLQYLFCRASGLGELTAKTRAAGRVPGIESVQVTLNREMLVGTRFVHRLVQERIDAWSQARPTQR
ncbi:MAG TPA: winged helix-turn-helix transcriptional regulator [Thermoplasmata archaeon]|nr:winged helix-turn-helix transcriptional regulator [Thermoplasmata archaeon]